MNNHREHRPRQASAYNKDGLSRRDAARIRGGMLSIAAAVSLALLYIGNQGPNLNGPPAPKSPFTMKEVDSMNRVPIIARAGDGPYQLTLKVDGIVPNTAVEQQVEMVISKESSVENGILQDNVTYEVPVLPISAQGPKTQ